MSKKGKDSQGADDVIADALRAVESREAESKKKSKASGTSSDKGLKVHYIDLDADNDNEESDSSQAASESGQEVVVAQVDLKKFIEREAYLRLLAEFENYRKRATKEKEEADRSGREKILRGFLEIFDNLERGLAQAKDDQSAIAEGLRMVLSQAETWLRAEGLERIESEGRSFDPTLHEAVSQIEDRSPSGTVVKEMKRGYRWWNRLLRPAAVIVSKGPGAQSAAIGSDSSADESSTD